ncbi:hypothetical protein FE263_05930 [Lichenicoccus roseus]|uniref:Phosphate ABC transporter substrate-binding protein n=2 Tax=Lichenicoccus roseus TaxID=2683649 RepID=A0A5R9J8W4_9PROT|nr:hypothetical protein FE263_05930 [Lichenicoccus roseus]
MRDIRARRLALPMYDLPELAWATDAFADALLRRLSSAGLAGLPPHREKPAELLALWRDPDLLMAQTCGYPLVGTLRARVRLVATPCYRAPGCEGAWMRSAIVIGAGDPAGSLEDLRGRVIGAINGSDSNSGMNLLRAAVAPLARGAPFFRDIIVTGSHVESLRAVRGGHAGLAAIDCVTLALLRRIRPEALDGVRLLDWTPASPGLPLVTATGTTDTELTVLRAALAGLLRDPALAAVREALLIEDFQILDEAGYAVIAELERQASEAGMAVLR